MLQYNTIQYNTITLADPSLAVDLELIMINTNLTWSIYLTFQRYT